MLIGTVTYRRRTDLVWRWFRGSVIVLGDGDRYQTLGGAAALVWSLLEAAMSEVEIIDAAERYGNPSPEDHVGLEDLVHEAVDILEASGLITSSSVER